MDGMIQFWNEYLNADCLERRKKLRELSFQPFINGQRIGTTEQTEHAFYTLLQFYFDDLIMVVSKRKRR